MNPELHAVAKVADEHELAPQGHAKQDPDDNPYPDLHDNAAVAVQVAAPVAQATQVLLFK